MTKVGGGLPDRRGVEGVLVTQRQEVVKTLPFPPLYKTTLIHTLHHTLHSLQPLALLLFLHPALTPFPLSYPSLPSTFITFTFPSSGPHSLPFIIPFNLQHFYFSFIRPSLPSRHQYLYSLHHIPFATFPSTLPFATFSSLPSLSHIPFTPFPPPHSLHSLPFTTFPSQFTTFHSLSSFPQIPFINTLHSLIFITFPSPHYPFLSDPSSIFLPIFPLSIYTTPLPLCPPFFLTPPPSNSFFHSIILELLCHTAQI